MDYTVELMKDFDKARLETMGNRIEELEAHISSRKALTQTHQVLSISIRCISQMVTTISF